MNDQDQDQSQLPDHLDPEAVSELSIIARDPAKGKSTTLAKFLSQRARPISTDGSKYVQLRNGQIMRRDTFDRKLNGQ